MVATLSKSGSGYTISSRRSYDPWGNLRLGSIYTEPTGRYCANLGHKTDDESAMIYMRARYYEPSVGRFISEDWAMDGQNLYVYCANEPVNHTDARGNAQDPLSATYLILKALMRPSTLQNLAKLKGVSVEQIVRWMIDRLDQIEIQATDNAAMCAADAAAVEASMGLDTGETAAMKIECQRALVASGARYKAIAASAALARLSCLIVLQLYEMEL